MKRTDTAPAGRKAESRNTYYRIGLAAAALGALILMSCSQDPIFAAIEKEVKLKEPSLRGDITSLVAVDGSLYAANGFLYKRTGGAGDWESVSTGGGDRCAMVATDGTHLYILCTDYDGENGVVRRLKGGTWETVTDISSAVFLSSGSGGVFAFTGSDDSYTAHRITVSPAVTALASGLSTPVGSAALAVSDYFATTGGVYTAAGALVVGPESLTGIRGITTNGHLCDDGRISVPLRYKHIFLDKHRPLGNRAVRHHLARRRLLRQKPDSYKRRLGIRRSSGRLCNRSAPVVPKSGRQRQFFHSAGT